MEFWSNVGANVVGTFVGAVLAVSTTIWFQHRDARANDRRQLQALLDRLHRSRALTPGQVRAGTGALDDNEQADFHRCTRSILATREALARTADHLSRPTTEATSTLDAMIRACLVYLNHVETDPGGYVAHLMQLRAELVTQSQLLVDGTNRLVLRPAGTATV